MSTNEYWNSLSLNPLLDIDDILSSNSNFINNNEYPNGFMSNKSQNEEEMFLSDPNHGDISSSTDLETSDKLPNFKCGVCGAPASGYNFNQITCESCKAFFRRNALRHMPDLKCRFSGSCVINMDTRRLCTYCRLKKCFDIQMRKDWIRTDEEKRLRELKRYAIQQKKQNCLSTEQQHLLKLQIVPRKKNRLTIQSINRNNFTRPIYSQKYFGVHRNLCGEDQTVLNNIVNAYRSEVNCSDRVPGNSCLFSSSLVQFLNREACNHEALIHFYKCIPEFKQLLVDDQVLLIKSNVHKTIVLHYILIENFEESPFIGAYMSKWINADFHNGVSRTRRYFDCFKEHRLILKLTLIVLLLSINLSTPENNYELDDFIDKVSIFQNQELYTTLLWRYLNYVFGEHQAIKSLEILVTKTLRFQTLMNEMEVSVKKAADCDEVHPLLQSLLRLT